MRQVAFYRNQTQPLNQLRGALRDQLYLVLAPPRLIQLKPEERTAFAQFFEGSETEPDDTPALRFSMLKTVLAGELEPTMKKLDEVLDVAMEDNYKFGLIQALSHGPDEGQPGLHSCLPSCSARCARSGSDRTNQRRADRASGRQTNEKSEGVVPNKISG